MSKRNLFWVVLLCLSLGGGLLEAQQRSRHSSRSRTSGRSRRPGRTRRPKQKKPSYGRNQFYAIFKDGKKIGYYRLMRNIKSGVVGNFVEYGVEVPVDTGSTRYDGVESHHETRAGKLAGFKISRYGGSESLFGDVINGDVLQVTSVMGSSSFDQRVPLPKGAVMTEGMRQLGRTKGFAEGTTYTVPFLDPDAMKIVPRHVVVGPTDEVDLLGKTATLTKITETFGAGGKKQTRVSYVDKEMWPMKMEMKMFGHDVVIVACDRVYAEAAGDWGETIRENLIKSPRSLNDAASARSIALHFKEKRKNLGIGEPVIFPISSGQTFNRMSRKRTIVVTVQRLAATPGRKFPYKGPSTPARLATRPSKYLQSRDKAVIAMARQAVGSAGDIVSGARAVEAFVRQYVKDKKFSPDYLSAVEVIEAKTGDCSERAILAAALCRAAGIPARIVLGIVYASEYDGQKNVFVPHVWAEVFDGTNWIGIDPSGTGWDPRRVAVFLGNVGPRNFAMMFDVLSRVTLEKVEITK